MSSIKSVKRALDILSLFDLGKATELGVTEAAQKLSMNKSTVARVLSTLESGNILVKSPTNHKYRVGQRIWELARVFLSTLDLRTVALPYLKELNEKINETISIYVMEGDQRICIERLESSQFVRPVIEVGQTSPVYAGAAGKLLLAYSPPQRIDELLEGKELPRYTEHTITSKEELLKELNKIRNEGIAVSHGEHVEFCASIAVPIMDYTGRVIAALAAAGLVMRYTIEREREILALLKKTADRVSRALGYESVTSHWLRS